MTWPARSSQDRYHAVIYAVGAQTDRRLGIPGEDLPGSWAATELVAWYNGHPDYRDLEFDLSCERAVVIGNGNVAADVARMLALTREELAATDVADHSLEVLADSGIREIVVLGRRGPAQAAFTNPELLELGEMTDADVYVDVRDAELDPLSRAFIESEAAHVTARKNVEILSGYAGREPEGKRLRIVLKFLVSPVEILGESEVTGIRIERNELAEDDDGSVRPRPTGEFETLDCGIVFRSIGYRGVPLADLPFDERGGVIPNDGGRVMDGDSPLPGEYVAGWIKRGPSGIIGTNKRDAQETVNLDAGGPGCGPPARALGSVTRFARGADRRPQPGPRGLRGLGGDRPRRALRGRAAWPPADQAGELRGAARSRPRPRGLRPAAASTPQSPARAPSAWPSSASRARSGETEMQVKIGVSDSV